MISKNTFQSEFGKQIWRNYFSFLDKDQLDDADTSLENKVSSKLILNEVAVHDKPSIDDSECEGTSDKKTDTCNLSDIGI